jgi:hypothetical protein
MFEPDNSPSPDIFIEVGSITIRPFDEDTVWLENADGDGFQTSKKRLEDALIKYFQEYH